MRDHFVCAALVGEEFAQVVVAETCVDGDLDASTCGVEEGGDQRFGVNVGGLDEDGGSGVADCR